MVSKNNIKRNLVKIAFSFNINKHLSLQDKYEIKYISPYDKFLQATCLSTYTFIIFVTYYFVNVINY